MFYHEQTNIPALPYFIVVNVKFTHLQNKLEKKSIPKDVLREKALQVSVCKHGLLLLH